ncbi:MAG: DUF389 domain-containing protein [Atopobiaceae bacterium]|nr:DUF389 domain-containing protein [Atopobiaceae bacterium]
MRERSFGSRVRRVFKIRKHDVGHKTLRKRIVEGAEIDGLHIYQLIAAMIIASIGLNVNSTEAIIGAMLICPLMGSVIAIAYAIAGLDMRLLKRSAIGLLVQVGVCLATSTVYFVISPLSRATSELLTNSSATVWDVLIAFVGGFAGALGISRKQEPATLIAGVAVATALMPPLCSTGYGFSARDLPLAAAALYEFLINVVFIAFGSEIVFVLLHVPLKSDLDGDGIVTAEEQAEAEMQSRRLRHRLIFFSIIFAVPCLFFSHQVVRTAMQENGTVFEVQDTYGTEQVTKQLSALCKEFKSYRIGKLDSYNQKDNKLEQRTVATVTLSTDIDNDRKEQLKQFLKLGVENLDEVEFEIAA